MVAGILLFFKLQKILKKIKSFAHGEFNKDDIFNGKILKQNSKGKDIFNRGYNLKS